MKCDEAANSDQKGGHSLRDPLAAAAAAPLPAGPWYDWKDDSGQLLMRVSHDSSATNWTILAGTALSAATIERIEIDAAGQVVQRQQLSTSTTSEGLVASSSGAPPTDVFTVFSARASNRALLNFYVNKTDRGAAKTKEYIEGVYNATFQ